MAFPSEFPDLPNYYSDHPTLLRKMILVIKNLMQGRSNNLHTVTLTANAATTTVTLAKDDFGEYSIFVFTPTTANAATEFGAGSMYVSSRDVLNHQFVITHTNTPSIDRIFNFAIIG